MKRKERNRKRDGQWTCHSCRRENEQVNERVTRLGKVRRERTGKERINKKRREKGIQEEKKCRNNLKETGCGKEHRWKGRRTE